MNDGIVKCDRCKKEINSHNAYMCTEGSIMTTVKAPIIVYAPSFDEYIKTNKIKYTKQLERLPCITGQIGFYLKEKELCEDCMWKLAEFMEGDK